MELAQLKENGTMRRILDRRSDFVPQLAGTVILFVVDYLVAPVVAGRELVRIPDRGEAGR
jgi:hypothetical protein